MTIAPDVRLRIIELRKEGYTYAAITEITGVAGAHSICKEAGLTGTGHGHLGRKSKYTEEKKQQVISLRNEGYTYAAVSEITGVALHNVAHLCKKAGAKSGYGHLGRKQISSPVAARNKAIRELREEGHTLIQIGELYGITRERVRQLCKGIDPPDLRSRSNCCVCGVEFVGYRSKYCCGECRKKGQTELHRQKNSKFSKHATVKLVCTGCGIKFERTNRLEGIAECGRMSKGREDSGRRFCSKECYYKKAFGR
jgi:transposase-like protein